MKKWLRTGIVCATAALILGVSLGAYAAAKPKDVVKYRKAVMKTNSAIYKNIRAITRGKVDFSAQLASQAAALNANGQNIALLFPAGTGPDKIKSRAKAAIWQDMAGLKAAAAKYSTATGKLAKFAKGGDAKAVKAQLKVVDKACRACHKKFRGKKKKK